MSKELIEKLREDGKFLGGNFGKLLHEAAAAPSAPATLPSVNQQLLEALQGVVKRCSKKHGGAGYVGNDGQYLKVIDAAIAAARNEGGKV